MRATQLSLTTEETAIVKSDLNNGLLEMYSESIQRIEDFLLFGCDDELDPKDLTQIIRVLKLVNKHLAILAKSRY